MSRKRRRELPHEVAGQKAQVAQPRPQRRHVERKRPLVVRIVYAGRCATPGCLREALLFCDRCLKRQKKAVT